MAGGPPLQTWKTDSLEGLDRGSRVWWKSSPTAWLPATLQNVGSNECTIALDTDSGPGTGQVRGLDSTGASVARSTLCVCH